MRNCASIRPPPPPAAAPRLRSSGCVPVWPDISSVSHNRHLDCSRQPTFRKPMSLRPAQDIPADWPNRGSSHRVLAAGLDWHVQLAGQGPLVVLLHGTGSSTHSWAPMWPQLTAKTRVLAIDLPGHGFTRGADYARLDLASIAQQLDVLLEVLDIGTPALVAGHSAGFPLALRWSLLGKHQASRLVGYAPSLVPPPPAYAMFLGPLINPLATSGPMASLLAATIGPSGMVDRLLDSTASILNDTQRAHYRTLFGESGHVRGAMNFMAAADLPVLLEDAAGLRTPMHLVVGELDAWVPAEPLLQVIRRYLPQARVERWHAGHLMHETEPGRAAQWLLNALGLDDAA
ncbi:MAG: alpha/beta fold hydrolase [Rhodocyclaceae bacterium]|nr:alpha/beta fold hydrolase [Rhodocyclaceae bacterium]